MRTRVLVFGASITQGFWDTKGGWVNRLREHYDQEKVKDIVNSDEPNIFNLGVSGDTTKNLLARFKPETKARHRLGDVMFIFSIGTNNAGKGEDRTPSNTEEYVEDLAELVEQAREFSQKIMFVGLPPCDEERTTPVYWRNVYYTNERIASIDNAMRKFCEYCDVPYVPVRDLFEGKEKELLADGIHPNDEGHRLIYERVKEAFEKFLND